MMIMPQNKDTGKYRNYIQAVFPGAVLKKMARVYCNQMYAKDVFYR